MTILLKFSNDNMLLSLVLITVLIKDATGAAVNQHATRVAGQRATMVVRSALWYMSGIIYM